MSTEVQAYAVAPTPFLNVEYPTDATNPTKVVNTTYWELVKNGTSTTTLPSTTEREVVVWAMVLYIILIIAFIVVAVVLLMKIKK